MLVHLSENLFSMFKVRADKEDQRPLVISGSFGSGRYTYIQEYLRHKECLKQYSPFESFIEVYQDKCNCSNCIKIVKEKSPDLVICLS